MKSPKRIARIAMALPVVVSLTAISIATGGVAHAAVGVTMVGTTTLTADPNLKQLAGGLQYVGGSFPDTSNVADGAILFNFKGSAGACSGTDVCNGGPNSSDYCYVGSQGTTDGFGSCSSLIYTANGSYEDHVTPHTQNGGSVVEQDVSSDHTFSSIYDCTGNCTGLSYTLQVNLAGIPTSGDYGIAVYLNNQTGVGSPSGEFTLCLNGTGATCTPTPAITLADGGGALVEWKITGEGVTNNNLTIGETMGGGTSGDDWVGGIFLMHNPGKPTAAVASDVHQARRHGKTVITWRSSLVDLGFNVFDRANRLNRRLVTQHAGRYHFVTARRVHHLRLVPVALR
jgi:hypothetical protein